MGLVEMQLSEAIKQAVADNSIEALFKKMASIIDRQAMALRSLEWNMHNIDQARELDRELFKEIRELQVKAEIKQGRI